MTRFPAPGPVDRDRPAHDLDEQLRAVHGVQRSQSLARILSRRDRGDLVRAEPDKSAEIAEQYFVWGYSEMLLAELFCNGIPLSSTVDGFFTYTTPLTNNEVYAIALTHLDSAIAAGRTSGGKSPRRHAARDEHQERGGDREGSRARRSWPIHRSGGGRRRRADELHVQRHLLAGDERQQRLGTGRPGVDARALRGRRQLRHAGITKNALPFSSAKDPRVPTVGSPTANGTKSIDGITPLVSQQIWLNRSDPIPVATGIDARLIEAEAKLNANDIAGMMTILNALRTAPQTLGPLRASPRHGVRWPAPADEGCGDEPVLSRKGVLAVRARHAAWRFAPIDSPVRPHGRSGLPDRASSTRRAVRRTERTSISR